MLLLKYQPRPKEHHQHMKSFLNLVSNIIINLYDNEFVLNELFSDGKPKIVDLAYLAKRDGNGLIQIIDRILEKDISTIQRCSYALLNSRDRPVQPEPATCTNEDKQRFCLEVLIKWLSTNTPKTDPTWNDLIECLKVNGLGDVAKDIKDNLG